MTTRVLARLLLVAACVAALPARAQDSLEAAKRRELEAIQQQAREKREAAQKLRGQENVMLSDLHRTEHKLSASRARLRNLESRGKVLGQQLHVTQVSLVHSEQALDQQRSKLGRRLRSLYKYGAERPLEFLLSTQSFAQLLSRWDFLVMVAEQDRVLLEDVMAKKAVVEENQHVLQGRLTEVARTTQATDRENRQLSQLRRRKVNTVQVITSQREAFEAAAAELERTARSMQRLLADLERKRQAESQKARAEGRTPEPYTGDFARGEGRLDWPVRGDIIGHYGRETNAKWGTVTMNNGVDIATPINTPVRVVAKGRVDYTSDDFGAYGQMVIVNHGDGFYTLYAHLSSISVSVGNEIAAGALVGYSGDTGSLKGAILHFEVRKGGVSLDPERWLK